MLSSQAIFDQKTSDAMRQWELAHEALLERALADRRLAFWIDPHWEKAPPHRLGRWRPMPHPLFLKRGDIPDDQFLSGLPRGVLLPGPTAPDRQWLASFLSPLALQIALRRAKGQSPALIAERLGVSKYTVIAYCRWIRYRIRRQLEADRKEALQCILSRWPHLRPFLGPWRSYLVS